VVLQGIEATRLTVNPRTDLVLVRSSALRYFERLERRASGALTLTKAADRDVLVGHVAVEALNAWGSFNRSMYLSGFAAARGVAGRRIHVRSIAHGASFDIAIHWAILAILRPPRSEWPSSRQWKRREEPSWHEAATLRRVVARLQFCNTLEIVAGLGIPSAALQDLPVYRNFFGHRGEASMKSAQRVGPRNGIGATLRPAEALLARPYGSGPPLLIGWLHDLELAIDTMCQ
jgi:hypothetical protein